MRFNFIMSDLEEIIIEETKKFTQEEDLRKSLISQSNSISLSFENFREFKVVKKILFFLSPQIRGYINYSRGFNSFDYVIIQGENIIINLPYLDKFELHFNDNEEYTIDFYSISNQNLDTPNYSHTKKGLEIQQNTSNQGKYRCDEGNLFVISK